MHQIKSHLLETISIELFNLLRAPKGWIEKLQGRSDGQHQLAQLNITPSVLEVTMQGHRLQRLDWENNSFVVRWSHWPQANNISELNLVMLQRPVTKTSARIMLKTLYPSDKLIGNLEQQRLILPYIKPTDLVRSLRSFRRSGYSSVCRYR